MSDSKIALKGSENLQFLVYFIGGKHSMWNPYDLLVRNETWTI